MNDEELQIPDEVLERLKDPDVLHRQVNEGLTFQEILGYSSEDMERFYTIAYQLFQREEYRRAADAFIFLTTLNPYMFNYWLGLGMAEQLAGEYREALTAYGMGILVNLEHPLTHYHSATCHQAQGDTAEAIAALNLAIRYAEGRFEFAHIKAYAESAKESLQAKF